MGSAGFFRGCLLGGILLVAAGCGPTITHNVNPIHITVNIKLIDKELDDLFAFEDKIKPAASVDKK